MTAKGSVTSKVSIHPSSSLIPQRADEATKDTGHDTYSDGGTLEEHGREWYPGDGICPSISQFNCVYQLSYNDWSSAASKTTQCDPSNPLYIEAFLDVLHDVPAFFHDPPKNVDLRGGATSPLTLRSSLKLVTTEDHSCEQSWKTIDYLQCFGFSVPMTYTTGQKTLTPPSVLPSFAPNPSGHLTAVTLAWSYIFCCRWVEILQRAGEKSRLRHYRGERIITNFWDLIIRSRWDAQVERSQATFYAPWMLREENSETQRYPTFPRQIM